MSYITIPAGARLSGTIQAISSKSDVHRLLICASLCPEPVKIKCFCADSKDILATSECLSALGAKIEFSDTENRVIKPIDMANVRKMHVCSAMKAARRLVFCFRLPLTYAPARLLTAQESYPSARLMTFADVLKQWAQFLTPTRFP